MRHAGPVAIERGAVRDRVDGIAAAIESRHGSRVTIVALLDEGAQLAADLASRLPGATRAGIRVSPFGAGPRAEARVVGDIPSDRPAIVAAAVIDTGLRLRVALAGLASAASVVEACALLDRPARRLVPDLPMIACGFVVPDCLFAGYGLGGPRRAGLQDIHFDDAESALSTARAREAIA